MQGIIHREAINRLYINGKCYSPDVLEILETIENQEREHILLTKVNFNELLPGMVAAENIEGGNGSVVISKGQEISWSTIQGLNNYIDHIGIKEPICVWQKK